MLGTEMRGPKKQQHAWVSSVRAAWAAKAARTLTGCPRRLPVLVGALGNVVEQVDHGLEHVCRAAEGQQQRASPLAGRHCIAQHQQHHGSRTRHASHAVWRAAWMQPSSPWPATCWEPAAACAPCSVTWSATALGPKLTGQRSLASATASS